MHCVQININIYFIILFYNLLYKHNYIKYILTVYRCKENAAVLLMEPSEMFLLVLNGDFKAVAAWKMCRAPDRLTKQNKSRREHFMQKLTA